MGTLNTNSIFPPQTTYPDKYDYWYPCANPNNNYEIAYCRDNHKTRRMDLYTYNFCTGKATLLVSNVGVKPDWSVKNWIIFVDSRGLVKIKPNGDSVTILDSAGVDGAKWSKDGTKYVVNDGKIFDEKGTLLYTLPYYVYLWKSNTEIIGTGVGTTTLNFEICIVDITTNTKTKSINIPMHGDGQIYTLYRDNLYFSVSSPHNNGNLKHYTLNINTLDTTFRYEHPQSFVQNITSTLNNKLLLQQGLRDTMTGDPLLLNCRSHIAIMNVDGSNERQVLIPE